MLEYERVDKSKGIDANKSKESHRRIIYNYYYFPKVTFRLKSKICNACHDLIQKTMSFDKAAIVSFKGNDYRIHFWYMSKDEAVNKMKNSDLTEKKLNIIKL